MAKKKQPSLRPEMPSEPTSKVPEPELERGAGMSGVKGRDEVVREASNIGNDANILRDIRKTSSNSPGRKDG